MASSSSVLSVTLADEPLEIIDKLQAHQEGKLHRALSVFILTCFLDKSYILLQRRALDKYHSGGLWSNTCCTHPLGDKSVQEYAQDCLDYEMGMKVPLNAVGTMIYKADVGNGLVEHELDHLFLGFVDDLNAPIPFNKAEVMEVKWMSVHDLCLDLVDNLHLYTPWLPKALNYVLGFR